MPRLETERVARTEERRDWMDLGWTAVLQAEDEYADTHATFYLYFHEGLGMDGEPHFWQNGASGNLPGTTRTDDADHAAQITVKWDGCGDIGMQEFLHICDKEDVENFSAALSRCYDWAREIGMDRL